MKLLREIWHAFIHGPYGWTKEPMFSGCPQCRKIYNLPEKKPFNLGTMTVNRGECVCGATYWLGSTSPEVGWAQEQEQDWWKQHQGKGHGLKEMSLQ